MTLPPPTILAIGKWDRHPIATQPIVTLENVPHPLVDDIVKRPYMFVAISGTGEKAYDSTIVKAKVVKVGDETGTIIQLALTTRWGGYPYTMGTLQLMTDQETQHIETTLLRDIQESTFSFRDKRRRAILQCI